MRSLAVRISLLLAGLLLQGREYFYEQRELPRWDRLAAMPEAARARRLQAARRERTSRLLVRTSDTEDLLAATGPLQVRKSRLLDGWLVVSYVDAASAVRAEAWLREHRSKWDVQPVVARHFEKRGELQRLVNDTLYVNQWHFAGFGVHVNIQDVWDRVTGRGINLAIVDDGVEIAHEDLAPNAYPLHSGYHHNFTGDAAAVDDPSPGHAADSHGTACAGLAGAAGFNDLGVVGVAPEARLIGLRLLAGASLVADDDAGDALAWEPEGLAMHVSSNSWGPPDDGRDSGRVGTLQLAGLEKGATSNRGGLGTVFTIANGNGRAVGDDSSYDAFAGSRFAIAVAAVNRFGEQNSSSESGMNVAIAAPGGEGEPPGAMWTTARSGAAEFESKNEKYPGSMAPANYTDVFEGTSAAAPLVAGAAALLLEQNALLSYRDVKEILLRSALRDGLTGSDEFAVNGGGLRFSHAFGAGMLNVAGALELAAGWVPLGPLLSMGISNTAPSPISDHPETPLVRNLDMYGGQPLRVEHVELTVTVKHPRRGDLSFTIVSPSGMRSTASARMNDDGADFENYTFTSVRHWGETSTGMWKVILTDTNANGMSGELQDIHLRLFGTAAGGR